MMKATVPRQWFWMSHGEHGGQTHKKELEKYGVYPFKHFSEVQGKYRDINNAMLLVKDNWKASGQGDDSIEVDNEEEAGLDNDNENKWLGGNRLRFLGGRNPTIMYYWYAMLKCGNLVYCDTQLRFKASGDSTLCDSIDDDSCSSKRSKNSSNVEKEYMVLAMESNKKIERMMKLVEQSETNKVIHMRTKELNKQKMMYNSQIDSLKSKKWEIAMNCSNQETKLKILKEIDEMIGKKELELEDLCSKEENGEPNETQVFDEQTPKRKNSSSKRHKSND